MQLVDTLKNMKAKNTTFLQQHTYKDKFEMIAEELKLFAGVLWRNANFVSIDTVSGKWA